METITLGGGCFWCLEPIFAALQGVAEATPGYAGGHLPHPTYAEVCSGQTGHAEVVAVRFDPEELPLGALLEVFFAAHDPTTRDRQGPDVGSQYRSIVLCAGEDQEEAVRAFIASLPRDPHWEGGAIVTEVRRLDAFHPAEAHHRDYFRRHPEADYCRLVIAPKLRKLLRRFAARLRPEL